MNKAFAASLATIIFLLAPGPQTAALFAQTVGAASALPAVINPASALPALVGPAASLATSLSLSPAKALPSLQEKPLELPSAILPAASLPTQALSEISARHQTPSPSAQVLPEVESVPVPAQTHSSARTQLPSSTEHHKPLYFRHPGESRDLSAFANGPAAKTLPLGGKRIKLSGSAETADILTQSAWLFDGKLDGPLDDPALIPEPAQAQALLGSPYLGDRTSLSSLPPLAHELTDFALSNAPAVARLALSAAEVREQNLTQTPEAAVDALLNAFALQHPLTPQEHALLRQALLARSAYTPSLLDRLALRDLAVETTRALMTTLAQVRRLLHAFFPAFDAATPVVLAFRLDSSKTNGFFISSASRRYIGDAAPGFPLPERSSAQGPTPFDAAHAISANIARLVLLFHEYAHNILSLRVHAPPLPGEPHNAFEAINEGFAVMLELLMIDKAVAAREELGLTQQDASDLLEWKRGRLSSLRRLRNHYTKGTLGFWHGIYKQGGEAAMLKTLDGLSDKQLRIPIEDSAFVLAAGEPELSQAFTRQGGQAWSGLLALSAHIQDGRLLEGPQLEAARWVLARIRPAAMKRFFGLAIGRRNASVSDLKKSADSLDGALRLAALDPAAARLFIDFVLDHVSLFSYGKLNLLGQVWLERLFKGMDSLPLSSDDRAAWRSVLEAWAKQGESYSNPAALELIRGELSRQESK
ncbi:MAG: hypothetical protein WCU88_08240 [Elusimicrobiota bacterium]